MGMGLAGVRSLCPHSVAVASRSTRPGPRGERKSLAARFHYSWECRSASAGDGHQVAVASVDVNDSINNS